MKKQLIVFILFCLLLVGIVIATPALENIYGSKNFVDGIIISDPNTASISSTGGGRFKCLSVNTAADPNYIIKSSVFAIDPNGKVGIGTISPRVALELNNGSGVTPAIYINTTAVAHGVTTWYPTNVTGYIGTASTTRGGLYFAGLKSNDTIESALNFHGIMQSGSSSIAAIDVRGYKANGTSVQNLGTTDKVFSIYNNTSELFNIYGNGTVDSSGLYTFKDSVLIVDDGTVTLPTITTGGMLKVWCSTEFAEYFIASDGTVSYIRMSLNCDDIDNDTFLCVYDGGSTAIIKNRLGGTRIVGYILEYN